METVTVDDGLALPPRLHIIFVSRMDVVRACNVRNACSTGQGQKRLVYYAGVQMATQMPRGIPLDAGSNII